MAAAVAALAAACDVGQGPSGGFGEPLQVAGAQFIPGELPGAPPLPADAGETSADAGLPALSVVSFSAASRQVVPGISGKSIGGDVTSDAVAVGVRLVGRGTGYWVVPVGAPDLQIADALTFGMSMSFDADDPPGLQPLRFVAIGPSGAGGRQSDFPICINARIPDNGHACDPTIAPPRAVFSLQWDSNFDLDLHVIAPSGVDYNPKMPLGEPLEAGVLRSLPKDAPFVDRDSLRGCQPDGLRQEDLVFPETLPKGTYHVFVDPYAACGQNAAHFTFTLYESTGTCPACALDAEPRPAAGEVLASGVTGGAGPLLFVQDVFVK